MKFSYIFLIDYLFAPVIECVRRNFMISPDLPGLRRLNESAWDEAFPWLSGKARNSAKRYLRGNLEHEVEDVVAETLEALVRCIGKVKDLNHLASLTVVIAQRKAVNHLRRKQPSADPIEENEEETASEACNRDFELAQIVNNLLSSINQIHRDVLIDRFYKGLSYKEIAAARKISIDTVGVYIDRGKKQMKAVMQKNSNFMKEIPDEQRLLLIVVTIIFLYQ